MALLPAELKRNDTIAFVSPSAQVVDLFAERVERATAFFESRGYFVKLFRNQSQSAPTLQQSIQSRCDALHAAFLDQCISAIVCTIGGLSANELLPYLDYDLIRKNPKLFIGYSDITILHYALYTKAGIRTFYGPAVIPQWGEYPEPMAFTTDHFFMTVGGSEHENGPPRSVPRSLIWTREFIDWTSAESSARARKQENAPGWKWLQKGNASGRIFGGCLPSILQLKGTPYNVDYTDRVLFIELCEGDGGPDTPISIALATQMMSDLAVAEILGHIRALIVGRPFMYDEYRTVLWEKAVLEVCEIVGMSGPILCGVDVGHTDPILTIPYDALVRLDSAKDEWTILEPAVELSQ